MSKPAYTVYTKDFANMLCRRLERENKKKDKEIERLHSIIKEVREYIGSKEHYEDDFDTEIEKVYKILEKEK